MTRRSFSGKVVLISGAAGGLGAALCARYAAAGAHIAAMDVDAARLETLATELRGRRAQVLALPGDISDRAACEAAVAATVAHFGALDGLINNAGISHRSLLRDTDPAVIRRVMEVNFFGALCLTHAALPRTGYAASKHALHGFFDSLRSELQGTGVGVTLVCPSFIATGIGAAGLGGRGGAASGPRITPGGESSARDIAARIFDAVVQDQPLLLPDGTARKAWWLSRLAPALYARVMRRRVGAEFATLPKA